MSDMLEKEGVREYRTAEKKEGIPAEDFSNDCKLIDGQYYLIKGGNPPYFQEPFNEVLGTALHRKLGFSWYVPYELVVEEGKTYCKGEHFLSPNTEFVSAEMLLDSMGKSGESSYEEFLEACEKLELWEVRGFLDYMLVFDYLMNNTERDFRKFGLIRHAEAGEWVGPAPIFETGTSLWYDKSTKELLALVQNPESSEGTKEEDSSLLEHVSDFSWIRFERLKTITEELKEVFGQSDKMEPERILALSGLMEKKISTLMETAEERRNMMFFYNIY